MKSHNNIIIYLFWLLWQLNLQEKIVLVLVPGGIFLGEGVDFWPHPIMPISLSPPPPLQVTPPMSVTPPSLSQSVLYYVTQCFLERTIEYWHKERLRIRLFLFTHCRVALSAVSKGVGGSRESIVCEILHCTYQDPLPSPLQCACPQLLLGFNIAFTTCASPIKHLVPPPLPAQQRIKLYSLCF